MLSKVLAGCFIYILITIYVLYKIVIPMYERSNSLIKFFIVVFIIVISFGIPALVIYGNLFLV